MQSDLTLTYSSIQNGYPFFSQLPLPLKEFTVLAIELLFSVNINCLHLIKYLNVRKVSSGKEHRSSYESISGGNYPTTGCHLKYRSKCSILTGGLQSSYHSTRWAGRYLQQTSSRLVLLVCRLRTLRSPSKRSLKNALIELLNRLYKINRKHVIYKKK